MVVMLSLWSLVALDSSVFFVENAMDCQCKQNNAHLHFDSQVYASAGLNENQRLSVQF